MVATSLLSNRLGSTFGWVWENPFLAGCWDFPPGFYINNIRIHTMIYVISCIQVIHLSLIFCYNVLRKDYSKHYSNYRSEQFCEEIPAKIPVKISDLLRLGLKSRSQQGWDLGRLLRSILILKVVYGLVSCCHISFFLA